MKLGMGFAVQHNEGGTEVQVAGQYYPVGNFISQEASNPNDMKPICHTEEEVCKAYKSGKPLLGDCQGKLWVPEKPKTPPPKTQKPEPEDDEKEESDEIKELDESGEEKHVQRLKFGFGDGEMASAGGSKLFKMLSMFDSMKGGKIKVIHIGGPGLASLLG
ncbi:uncharacterized protein LOC118432987 isoform X2 [Folsomia candida]|uniref:uncharacterized protein LOC118432987 isoform X2 n=1 Tax=Folsomia candida TaxID=158441 RepID=UPI001604A877|nr:uncharacterized protein LOC118432987 isoform X2 [Folsomia candida]